MEGVEGHVHIFVEVPSRYSSAQVVQILKSISAREVFKKFPKLKKQLWAGEFWSDGYFARSVGDKVTADVIRKYIESLLSKIIWFVVLDKFFIRERALWKGFSFSTPSILEIVG